MSTLSNIFATDDADQAQDGTSQQAADDAAVAPGTPGYDPNSPDTPDGRASEEADVAPDTPGYDPNTPDTPDGRAPDSAMSDDGMDFGA